MSDNVQKIIVDSINALKQLNQSKRSFGRRIKSRVGDLFKLLSPYQIGSIQQMCSSLGSISATLLLKNKRSFSQKDLSEYLHLSLHNSDVETPRSRQQLIDESTKQQLIDIIMREHQISESLKKRLKAIDIQVMFNEVDFFGNGYIDAVSLVEYLKNQGIKSDKFSQECSQIIALLKNSASAEKIFVQDFQNAIRSPTEIEDKQVYKFQQKRSAGHIAKISEFASRCNQVQNKKEEHTLLRFKQEKGFESKRSMNKDDKPRTLSEQDLCDIDYELRLVTAHPRNKKYIEKLKKDLQISYLPSNYHLSSISSTVSVPQKTEFLFSLKNLGQSYYKYMIEITDFFQQNPEFNFLNGFNVLDQKEKQMVLQKEFYDFLVEENINIQHQKAIFFFKQISKGEQNLKYHNYMKIFKLKYLQPQFLEWRLRKAIYVQKWSEKSRYNYCRLLRNLINLKYSQRDVKKSFIKLAKSYKKSHPINFQTLIEIIFEESNIHRDKMQNILGDKSSVFIHELYQESSLLSTSAFQSFFSLQE